MEIFLHLWDELDDLSALCRHMTATTLWEVGHISGAAGAALGALVLAILRLPG